MNRLGQVARLSSAVANTGKFGVVPNTPHYKKIMQLQEFFQVFLYIFYFYNLIQTVHFKFTEERW